MNRKITFNIIKTVVFLLLMFCMLTSILKIFNYKDMGGGGGWQRFYQAEDESIDVLFFGSSHVHCTIDHGLLWDDYGMAGYTLSAGSQMIDHTCYFVKEALKSQKPKVIVVEMIGVLGGELSNSSTEVYRNSLGMRWSSVFGEYIDYLSDNMEMEREEKQQVFLKIPVIHSRYAELTKSDFEDTIPFMRGYRGSYESVSFEKPSAAGIQEVIELDSQRFAMLWEIIDTANENSIPIVLFAAPYVLSEEEQMQFNAVEVFAKQQGIPFINYNKLYDELSIDFETDFRDEGHVNNYGAAKVTEHMAQYLKDNYGIPDRKGSAGYELWEDNALYLRNKALRNELEKAVDINEYFQILSKIEEEQTVIIGLTGNYSALGEVYLESLMRLGITSEEYAEGGMFIFRKGRREVYFPGKEYNYCIDMARGEIHVESDIYEVEEDIKDKVHILLNGNDYVMVENGVNMIVYNETIDQLVDAAGADVYLGLELIHCGITEE